MTTHGIQVGAFHVTMITGESDTPRMAIRHMESGDVAFMEMERVFTLAMSCLVGADTAIALIDMLRNADGLVLGLQMPNTESRNVN